MERRVVITGMGAVTPIGNNVKDFWQSMKEGRSGIGPNTRVNIDKYPSKVAGEVKDFNPDNIIDKRELRKMDRYAQFCVAASIEAMTDANFKADSLDPERIGVILGNGIGGLESLEDAYHSLFEKGRVPVMVVPKMISNIGPAHVAITFNAQGPCYSVVTACASATDALGNAADWIRKGICDVMISGGAEAAIVELAIGGFCAIQALSTRFNDNPQKASRPFDKDRDGFVMGEGAGILILEDYEHAKKRGARIYAEFAGYG
ncbi:MAG: beta-ketoacyl-[acyl-carrier-protein] synthase II, partial [Spirochaetales bacterium]